MENFAFTSRIKYFVRFDYILTIVFEFVAKEMAT